MDRFDSEPFFRDILELADLAIMVIDHDFRVVYANKFVCEQIAGMPQSAVIGMLLPEHTTVPDEDLQRVIDHTKRVLKNGVAERIENWALHKDGTRRLMHWSSVPKLSRDGKVEYLLAAGMDVTEQRKEKNLLENLAHQDVLTGLHNRIFFEKKLSEEIMEAAEENTNVALLYIDLDGFKPVNDQHGHEAGDAVLREVAVRLKKGLRQNDIVCRIGGDEFAAILPGVSTQEDAARIAEQMIVRLTHGYDVSGGTCQISASIGIAFYDASMNGIQELIRKADSAMYYAKRSGKGKFAFAD